MAGHSLGITADVPSLAMDRALNPWFNPDNNSPAMKPKFILACLLFLACIGPASAKETNELDQLKQDTAETVEIFQKADSTIKKFFENAAGYVVFPHIAKGGLGIGAAHGKGLMFEKGKITGQASVTQVTIGAQIGGQVLREIVFLETKEAVARFKESQTALSAQVSAVAAAEGAGEKAKYEESVAVFTKPKQGLMAEASVGGQKFKFTPIK
jgi:lipid-binding SYLF domain-containing protein